VSADRVVGIHRQNGCSSLRLARESVSDIHVAGAAQGGKCCVGISDQYLCDGREAAGAIFAKESACQGSSKECHIFWIAEWPGL
jgi:hypothetical protein